MSYSDNQMAESPFRERTLSPEEIQRVLRRAAELSASAPLATTELTETKLIQRLKELGMSDDVIQNAMQPTERVPPATADGAMRVEREVVMDGMLDPSHFESISELIAGKMKLPGRISAVGGKLTWSPAGLVLEPSVTLHAKEGRTTIRYVETLANRGQMAIGFGVLSVMGGFFAAMISIGIGTAIGQGSGVPGSIGGPIVLGLSIVLGLVATVGCFVGLKRSVAKRAVRRGAFADSLIADVAEAVRAKLSAPTRTRVEERPVEEVDVKAEDDAASGVLAR